MRRIVVSSSARCHFCRIRGWLWSLWTCSYRHKGPVQVCSGSNLDEERGSWEKHSSFSSLYIWYFSSFSFSFSKLNAHCTFSPYRSFLSFPHLTSSTWSYFFITQNLPRVLFETRTGIFLKSPFCFFYFFSSKARLYWIHSIHLIHLIHSIRPFINSLLTLNPYILCLLWLCCS